MMKLKAHQTVALGNLLTAEYEQSDMTDQQFADLAKKRLGFPVSASSIGYLRRGMNIQSTSERKAAKKSADLDQLLSMILALEARVAALESKKA